MTLRGTAGVALILTLGLGACTSMKTSREQVVKAPQRCVDQTVQIYFEAESADLTKEGRQVLAAAAAQARPCKVAAVDVLGLADSVGAPDANLELSKRRAQSVTAALSAAGLPAAEFKVQAVGDAGATTAGGQAKPLRRRADVVLHLQPG